MVVSDPAVEWKQHRGGRPKSATARYRDKPSILAYVEWEKKSERGKEREAFVDNDVATQEGKGAPVKRQILEEDARKGERLKDVEEKRKKADLFFTGKMEKERSDCLTLRKYETSSFLFVLFASISLRLKSKNIPIPKQGKCSWEKRREEIRVVSSPSFPPRWRMQGEI